MPCANMPGPVQTGRGFLRPATSLTSLSVFVFGSATCGLHEQTARCRRRRFNGRATPFRASGLPAHRPRVDHLHGLVAHRQGADAASRQVEQHGAGAEVEGVGPGRAVPDRLSRRPPRSSPPPAGIGRTPAADGRFASREVRRRRRLGPGEVSAARFRRSRFRNVMVTPSNPTITAARAVPTDAVRVMAWYMTSTSPLATADRTAASNASTRYTVTTTEYVSRYLRSLPGDASALTRALHRRARLPWSGTVRAAPVAGQRNEPSSRRRLLPTAWWRAACRT